MSVYQEYAINTSQYEERTMFTSAHFQNGVFRDFYMGIVLARTPEVPEVLPRGNIGAIMTLTDNRRTGFFNAKVNQKFSSVEGQSLSLTSMDANDKAFWVGSY